MNTIMASFASIQKSTAFYGLLKGPYRIRVSCKYFCALCLDLMLNKYVFACIYIYTTHTHTHKQHIFLGVGSGMDTLAHPSVALQ